MNPAIGLLALAFSISMGASGVRSPEVIEIYSRPLTPSFHGHFAVRPLPCIGFGLQASFGARTGTGMLVQSLEASSDEARMHVGTVALRFEGRLDVAPYQPLIPYLVAGPMATFWRETVGTSQRSGGKMGAHVGAGLCFLLTPETAWSLQPRPRLEGVYLVVEGGHRWARWASGEGLDLGGWHLHGGVEVAIR